MLSLCVSTQDTLNTDNNFMWIYTLEISQIFQLTLFYKGFLYKIS